jgi:four helix bundle suffix protein
MKSFSPFRKPASFLMARCASAHASLTSALPHPRPDDQAARSGKQNILEASQASGTSKETELKLTNVARASLEELLEDYRDILRTGGHPLWNKNSKEALFVRRLGAKSNVSYESYRSYVETRPAHIVANILICLIHQTNYLLDQQIRRLEKDFLKEGGLRERMTRARLASRSGQRWPNANGSR